MTASAVEWATAADAAKILGRSEKYAARLGRDGRIRYTRTPDGELRFSAEDVRAWAEAMQP